LDFLNTFATRGVYLKYLVLTINIFVAIMRQRPGMPQNQILWSYSVLLLNNPHRLHESPPDRNESRPKMPVKGPEF